MMKQVFVTACAVAALYGTAMAQTPATKDNAAPAAKPNMAQPANPSNPTTGQPANQGTTGQSNAGGQPNTANQSQTSNQPNAQKTQPPLGVTAVKPQGEVHVTFYAVKPADIRASNLIGSTVYNVNNETIGEIEDVILEDGKTLRAVVIGVGGFLGIGEHYVAVEPGALVVTRNTDKEDMRIVLNTTKNDLKNAPAVQFDKESRDKAAANDAAKPGNTSRPAATTGAGDMSKPGMGQPDKANPGINKAK
jgi:hypothetical protein